MNQNIGDMVVCSPILREIKLKFPKSELEVLASNANIELAMANPYIDKVLLYRNQWINLLPMLIRLRRAKIDVVIELEAKVVTKAIIMMRIIKPNCILALSKTEGRYGMPPDAILPYDYYTDPILKHQRDTALDILRLLNIKSNDKSYDVFYNEKHRLKALSFFNLFDKKNFFIGLNLEGSSKERKIFKNDAINLISGLAKIQENIIIILIHKPENVKNINELITNEASLYTFPSYPTNSVLDLAAIIDGLDLIISPDTSIVHMACAFKKPLIAIYEKKMNNYEKWHPISDCNHVIFFDSLKYIDVNKVIDEAYELISNNNRN